jgi:hypothetical protein
LNFLIAYNYARTTNLTVFVNRNDPRLYNGVAVFERPNGSGIGEIRSTESIGKSRYQGLTFTVNKAIGFASYYFKDYVLECLFYCLAV